MYQIYNERTGVIVRRARSLQVAVSIAESLTELNTWVLGDTFDVRVV